MNLIKQLTIKTTSKIDIQKLILQLIIDQYLKEDFYFTGYTTVCYVKLGPKARYVNSNDCEIVLDQIESVQTTTSNTINKEGKQFTKETSTLSDKINFSTRRFSFVFLIENFENKNLFSNRVNRFVSFINNNFGSERIAFHF